MKSLCKQRAPSPMIGKPNDIDGTIPIQNGRALWLKYIHDSFSKRKEIVMKQLKLLITLIGIMSVSLTIGSCVNEPLPEGINDTNNIKTFPEMSEKEGVLIDLASVMPGVLNDPELSKIIYESAKVHEEDEAYTLWSEIADKPTPSGKTIRQAIQQIQANLKTTSSTTSLFDSLDYLQVYIHAFELWDGVSPLPVTYTPLTIDDVDVTELTLYDTLGNETILEIDTTNIPDYPIAIVGLNEGAAMADEMGLQTHLLELIKRR